MNRKRSAVRQKKRAELSLDNKNSTPNMSTSNEEQWLDMNGIDWQAAVTKQIP